MKGLIAIEFYQRGGALLARIHASAVPREGEYINIRSQQWRVAYTAWALDTNPPELRANVELDKVPDDEVGPLEKARAP
jgi:hypothetical protein